MLGSCPERRSGQARLILGLGPVQGLDIVGGLGAPPEAAEADPSVGLSVASALVTSLGLWRGDMGGIASHTRLGMCSRNRCQQTGQKCLRSVVILGCAPLPVHCEASGGCKHYTVMCDDIVHQCSNTAVWNSQYTLL